MTETERDEIDPRVLAVAEHMGYPVDGYEIEAGNYGRDTVTGEGAEWLALEEVEIEEAVRESIEESLWCFRPEFLAEYTDLPQEIFECLADRCEDANDVIRTLVDRTDSGIEGFVSDAMSADGAGPFLASYDHEEVEVEVDGQTFYLYRVN